MRSLGGSIVGRLAERRALQAFLAPPPTKPSLAVLVLEGEAGVGKTTLWRSAVDSAQSAGVAVLWATPGESEVALPFAALGDLLGPVVDDHLGDLAPPQRNAVAAALQVDAAPEPVTQVAVARGVLTVLERIAAARAALTEALEVFARARV